MDELNLLRSKAKQMSIWNLVLIAVLIIGTYQRGSRSWFTLPFFSIQPSEFCRVAIILIVSSFLSRNDNF